MSSDLLRNAAQGGEVLGPEQANSTLVETLGVVASAVVDTASTLAAAAAENVKRRAIGQGGVSVASGTTGAGAEGLRTLFGKREWRVPCLDILVRL